MNYSGYPCKKCGATEPENDPMIPSGSHVCAQKVENPDHVLVSRALLREAADLIKETFGGIDMVRRLREAAGEGEG